jgi:RNA polymerase sigma factor (sigma-70 family)
LCDLDAGGCYLDRMRQTDSELLQRYGAERAEPAFAELVRRHIDLVFSAALRQAQGDRQLAEDVTQSVFSDLARKAARLEAHTSLAGWLYTSTCYCARSARRSDRRRQVREQQAFAMNQLLQPEPSVDWERLGPLLDEAMLSLNESDRQAVLLRFFKRLPLAEVGAHLAVSENAARMRVDRALEKLRGHFQKRGFGSTAAVLAALLSNYAVGAAPAGLAATVSSAAVAAGAAAASGGLAAILGLKALTVATAVVVVLAVVWAVRHHATPNPPATLAAQAAPQGNSAVPVAGADASAAADASPGAVSSTTPPVGPVLTLRILDAKNDQALAGVQIDYRAWSNGVQDHRALAADAQGTCVVPYLEDTTNLVLITEREGYADTRLSWQPVRGEAIPQSYTLRPGPALPMAGRVVNKQGQPVAGATVEWSIMPGYDAAGRLSPESHTVEGVSAKTDANGLWHVNRVAGDLFHRLAGTVTHPGYGNRFVSQESNPGMDQQLRDGSLLITLSTTVTIRGMVVDANGRPVARAKVLVGRLLQPEHRQATTLADGSFKVDGCTPDQIAGQTPITAEADGFAPAGVLITVAAESPPVRLEIQPPQTLHLRVAGPDGTPIPGANVRYNWACWDLPLRAQDYPDRPDVRAKIRSEGRVVVAGDYPDLAVAQVKFNDKTGPDGRLTWTNAPRGELMFTVNAPGFTQILAAPSRADGEEHLITLTPGTLVIGEVRDESSGAPMPRFRVVLGHPERMPFLGHTNVHWISNRTREFSDGSYSQDLARPLVIGPHNPGYVLKFEAAGYEPFVSRIFDEGEGEVHLDVSLRPSQAAVITVLKPNGQPAAGAEVGLVSPGAQLKLGQGSFIRDPLTTAVLETEVDGRFRFTSGSGVTRIIIACADGYLSSTPERLKTAPTVRLEPWGSIEGICVADGKPVAGQKYKLALEDENLDTVMCGFQAYQVESDTEGRFTIPRAPPGNHNLQRVTTVPGPNGDTSSWGPEGQTPVTVRPGETTPVTLQQ